MADQSSNYGQPDEWSRYRNGAADQQYSGQGAAGQQYYGQGAGGQQYYGQATAQSGLGQPAAPPAGPSSKRQGAQKNFFAALFDFSFTSFINTRVIKVLYVLVVVVTVLGALAFAFSAFKVNATLGVLALVIVDPLYVIIVLTLWRLLLEACIVFFRIGEDVRALRERGETR